MCLRARTCVCMYGFSGSVSLSIHASRFEAIHINNSHNYNTPTIHSTHNNPTQSMSSAASSSSLSSNKYDVLIAPILNQISYDSELPCNSFVQLGKHARTHIHTRY